MSILSLPPLDRKLSPYTGWTRAHWLHVADAILDGAARRMSPSGSLVRFPGAPGGYGSEVDALEGFARTFLLASFRIAGDPDGTERLAERYRRGFEAGVDPDSGERWLRPDEVDQAKVEAAALALGLHLTRAQIWNRMSDRTRQQTAEYLATFIGGGYPPNNWAWFRIMVEQFLASVGADWSPDDVAEDLALVDSFPYEKGWQADGLARSYDHYCGWALPFYPVIWAGMVGDDPRHAERIARSRTALDDYLADALHLVGADGAPLFQGRSLTYRFASAAPAWAAAVAGSERFDPGLLRRAASGQVAHFVAHGAPDAEGVLSLGWHGPWRAMAQNYSGPGSPYWASKGMLGIALPADHSVWTAVEQPLPVERAPFARLISAPGWLATGTEDGVVRLVNHGTDHGHAGDHQPDGPLYAKLGYSTAMAPVLRGDGVLDPVDGAVALLREGRPSHRSGFARGPVGALPDETLAGGSTATAHWPLELAGEPDHGHGDVAIRTALGPEIDVVSIVRGAWEVRFWRVRGDAGDHDGVVRVGGWALTGRPANRGAAWTETPRLASRVVPLTPVRESGVLREDDVTPLAGESAVPWILAEATPEWGAAAILLGAPAAAEDAPRAEPDDGGWRIAWPAGPDTVIDPGAWCADTTPTPDTPRNRKAAQ
ncbi:DUF2264 domain-containing protein [Microbacterium sp. gxy059]|uniref:DUF2264 domain-containing protein n=1 Tax=Microbacterium sp. gxy059 TaxID=2957199 RepID=UPI003D98C74A